MNKKSLLDRPLIRYSMFCLGGFFVGVLFSGCETPYEISKSGNLNEVPVDVGPASGGGGFEPIGSPTSGPVTGTPTAAPACGPFSIKAGLYALSGSSVSISGQATVQGDAVVFNNSQVSLNGQAVLGGNLYFNVSNTNTLALNGMAAVSGKVEPNALNENAFIALSNSLSNLTPTASFASLSLAGMQTQTLTRSAKMNVITFSGDLSLSGQSALSLSGGATDVFVINIDGTVSISGQSEVLLTGGLLPQNVIFNNRGAGSAMLLTGQGDVAGNFIGVQRGVSLSGQGAIIGSVVGKGSVSLSGQGSAALTPAPFCAASSIL